jgi:hypothetical protein
MSSELRGYGGDEYMVSWKDAGSGRIGECQEGEKQEQ